MAEHQTNPIRSLRTGASQVLSQVEEWLETPMISGESKDLGGEQNFPLPCPRSATSLETVG